MKGLLIKDLYQLVKYCKLFFLVDLMFFAVALFSEENPMFVCFPVMFSGMVPLTLLSYDERGGWSDYSGVLPYNEKQIVSAKYLFGLFVQAAIVAFAVIVLFIRELVHRDNIFIVNLYAVGVMFIASLIFPAFTLPFCYKLGVEKARMTYIAFIAITVGISMPLYDKVVDSFNGADIPNMLLPFLLVGTVAAYIVSWVVSIPILKSAKK